MKDPIMNDRQFTEDTLVIATHNAGKMREIGALFAGFDIDILSAADLGLAEPDETETSFTGNAIYCLQTKIRPPIILNHYIGNINHFSFYLHHKHE